MEDCDVEQINERKAWICSPQMHRYPCQWLHQHLRAITGAKSILKPSKFAIRLLPQNIIMTKSAIDAHHPHAVCDWSYSWHAAQTTHVLSMRLMHRYLPSLGHLAHAMFQRSYAIAMLVNSGPQTFDTIIPI